VNRPTEAFGFFTFHMSVLQAMSGGNHAHDFMSYGPAPTWVSPYTYRRLFSKLQDALPGNAPQEAAANSTATEGGNQPQAPQPVLYVSGSISETGTAGTFTTVYKLPQLSAVKEGTGSYSLEIQNGSGQALSRRFFTPITLAEAEPGQDLHFAELIALPPQAARLVLKNGANVIAERQRSPNTPAVSIQSPAGGVVWGQNQQTIQWQGTDGDGDELDYVVQYSPDLGATWSTLAVNQAENSLAVIPRLLPGSKTNEALIRIFASDGFNSTSVQSAGFTVTGKAPFANILAPANGSVHQRGDLINFNGAATDLEDGATSEDAYHWSSNIDGDLGSGHDLNLRSLSIGRHTITLSVQDSNGQGGSDTIEIIVQETINTQPIADATPYLAVHTGTEVTLNGQGSFDPDHDALEYSWRLVSAPDGYDTTGALQDANTATPRFTATTSGDYVLELVVRDGQVNSNPFRVVVQAAEHISYLPAVQVVSGP
jgi:hypothetical protein